MANGDTIQLDPSLHLIPVTGQSSGTAPSPPTTGPNLSQFLGQQQSGSGQQATTQGAPSPVYGSLAQGRARFAQELQNPKVRNLMMASIDAEVGDQQAPAWQAYAESVMNRANATNRSLVDTIIDPYNPRTKTGYYPASTINKLGASMNKDQFAQYNPIIDSALSGSNISNLATGNESGRLHSMPVTYDPQSGERFVAEAKYNDWRQTQSQALASSTQPVQPQGQGPPIQQLMGAVTSSQLQDLTRYFQP